MSDKKPRSKTLAPTDREHSLLLQTDREHNSLLQKIGDTKDVALKYTATA